VDLGMYMSFLKKLFNPLLKSTNGCYIPIA
jgi:hypothetical protein